jgi:hypothetical protein
LTNGTTYFFKIVRNDFRSWVGMTIQIGNADLTVTQLGRLVVANNVGMHDVKIVDPAAGNAVVAMVTVNMPAGPIGEFAFVPLLASVRLSAFHLYHLGRRGRSAPHSRAEGSQLSHERLDVLTDFVDRHCPSNIEAADAKPFLGIVGAAVSDLLGAHVLYRVTTV